ncbi:hypothetical protein ACFUIW_33930 [Streptomyces sp. NPDC057245]|uniref:hypothetical protein n=1 Tax=Streptomyces sp. NPDC057245 TaxID=3346065 RepID=UPI003626B790
MHVPPYKTRRTSPVIAPQSPPSAGYPRPDIPTVLFLEPKYQEVLLTEPAEGPGILIEDE